MITAIEFPDRQFASKEELYKELRENKKILSAQKKIQTKLSDPVAYSFAINEKNEAVKSNKNINEDVKTIRIKAVINTTNIIDSHRDVSINGSWNRTVKNSKNIYLLQEHKALFSHIITDNVEAKVETFNWKELGFDYEGETEALVFYATIHKDRNPFMFEQYAKGYVKEHSAGLRYVQLELAINSEAEWDKEEKAVWDKHYPNIANKEEADEYGYFWAVIEQKIIEGSAVVRGSNFATPTISVEPVSDTSTKQQDSANATPKNVIQGFLINI